MTLCSVTSAYVLIVMQVLFRLSALACARMPELRLALWNVATCVIESLAALIFVEWIVIYDSINHRTATIELCITI